LIRSPSQGLYGKKLLLNLKNKQMKNLKKLSREELKTVDGGKLPGKWACCIPGAGCSTVVYGDSNDLYCEKGFLTPMP
jgi:hypothetical protein